MPWLTPSSEPPSRYTVILGPGYLERVYQKALEIELRLRGIPFQPQRPVHVAYKSFEVGEGFLDLLVDDQLIVELKAVDALAPIHSAQVISYLKGTALRLGLLINFDVPRLKDGGIRRVIYS